MKETQGKRYFPMFVDLSGKQILVIGGGRIAARRVKTLIEFCSHIRVIAPEIDDALTALEEQGRIHIVRKCYEREDLYGADLVVCAVDDPAVDADVRAACRCLGITVNVAGDRRLCDFYFPGIALQDNLVVGVCAGGSDHRLAARVTGELQEYLAGRTPDAPDDISTEKTAGTASGEKTAGTGPEYTQTAAGKTSGGKPPVRIYTDGSARGNPDGPGGYGVVMEYMDNAGDLHVHELSQGYRRTTNNRMELMGAIAGLEALKFPCRVDLYSDSQYLIHAFTENWIDGWIRKGWMRSGREPVRNRDLWERLLKAAGRHEVTWHWVRGHAGHPQNERCDQLATTAADSGDLIEDPGV